MTRDERRQAEIEAAKRWLLDGNGEKSYDTVEMLADFLLSRDEQMCNSEWREILSEGDLPKENGGYLVTIEAAVKESGLPNYPSPRVVESRRIKGEWCEPYTWQPFADHPHLNIKVLAYIRNPAPFVPPAPEKRGDEK